MTATVILALALIGGGCAGLLILVLNEWLENRRWTRAHQAYLDNENYGKGVDNDAPEWPDDRYPHQ